MLGKYVLGLLKQHFSSIVVNQKKIAFKDKMFVSNIVLNNTSNYLRAISGKDPWKIKKINFL